MFKLIIMDLQTKRQRIQELLSENLFLNEKNRARFMTIANGNNETKIDKIIAFLTQANQQERHAVKEKLESDPNFFSELKHGAYMKVLTDIKKREAVEKSAETDIFADLEAELNNL